MEHGLKADVMTNIDRYELRMDRYALEPSTLTIRNTETSSRFLLLSSSRAWFLTSLLGKRPVTDWLHWIGIRAIGSKLSLSAFHFTTAKNAWTHSHFYKSHFHATNRFSNQTLSFNRAATLDHARI